MKNPAALLLAVGSPIHRARLILGIIGAVLVAYLIFGENPWDVPATTDKRMRISHYVAIYFWIAAVGNLLVIGVLAATASWWVRPMPISPAIPPEKTSPLFRWLVAGAMVMGAILGWPRLDQSFWHDESQRVADVWVGTYKPNHDGIWKFRPVAWRDTVFYYRVPNHILQSIISRASNEIWRFVARPQGLQFSETAIRFPGYLAGIAAIGALALLLARLGFANAGILAAWVLAWHPWFLRYITEARAYNYMLLLIPLYFLAVRSIWKDGRGRAWVAFGLIEFLLMYVYPTSAFVLAVTNILLLPALFLRWRWTPELFTQCSRLVIANVAAAMIFLQLMLPCIPQFLEYVEKTPGQGDIGIAWFKNVGSFFLAGAPWSYSFKLASPYLELWPWADSNPLLWNLILGVSLLLLLVGLVRMSTKNIPAALFAIAVPVATALCIFESQRRGGYLFEWYVIFLLPALVAFLAIGLREVCRFLPTIRSQNTAFVVLSILLLSAYVAWTAPQRNFLRHNSLQPYRESVALTRPTLAPLDPVQEGIITATFYSKPFPYDPRIILFRNGAELQTLVREADAASKALFINLGFLVTVQGEHPHKYRFLKESGFFDDLGIIPGFMETLGRHVFRYRPGSAAGFDFSTIPNDIGRSDKDEKTPAVDIGGGNAYQPPDLEASP